MRIRRNLLLLCETNFNPEQLPLQSDSIIEKMICDPAFSYMRPWFYNHPYALRCELGIGDNDRIYMKNAYKRALEISSILFPKSPDAMMYDYVIEDYSCYDKIYVNNIAKKIETTCDLLCIITSCILIGL